MASTVDASEQEVVSAFHRLYYHARIWGNTYWMGIPTYKCPLDLWVYQEIIFELRPHVIVECGTFKGGSALFMASILDQIDRGHVLTVDIEERSGLPKHP